MLKWIIWLENIATQSHFISMYAILMMECLWMMNIQTFVTASYFEKPSWSHYSCDLNMMHYTDTTCVCIDMLTYLEYENETSQNCKDYTIMRLMCSFVFSSKVLAKLIFALEFCHQVWDFWEVWAPAAWEHFEVIRGSYVESISLWYHRGRSWLDYVTRISAFFLMNIPCWPLQVVLRVTPFSHFKKF